MNKRPGIFSLMLVMSACGKTGFNTSQDAGSSGTSTSAGSAGISTSATSPAGSTTTAATVSGSTGAVSTNPLALPVDDPLKCNYPNLSALNFTATNFSKNIGNGGTLDRVYASGNGVYVRARPQLSMDSSWGVYGSFDNSTYTQIFSEYSSGYLYDFKPATAGKIYVSTTTGLYSATDGRSFSRINNTFFRNLIVNGSFVFGAKQNVGTSSFAFASSSDGGVSFSADMPVPLISGKGNASINSLLGSPNGVYFSGSDLEKFDLNTKSVSLVKGGINIASQNCDGMIMGAYGTNVFVSSDLVNFATSTVTGAQSVLKIDGKANSLIAIGQLQGSPTVLQKLFLSNDSGASWKQVQLGDGSLHVTDFAIYNGKIYVSTMATEMGGLAQLWISQ